MPMQVMLTGSTDSRFYRAAGACSYGAGLLGPEETFGSIMQRFHGDDERISIRSLWTTAQFYALVVLRMMG
jgi:acetylornithine deacetylase/succinyl-diaminopimelate desuccinylase-like protein